MQSCCFGFEQHRGRRAVFSAAFHHAQRVPRVISRLTAESPTIRSFKTSLVSIQGFLPPVYCAQGRLVKRGKSLAEPICKRFARLFLRKSESGKKSNTMCYTGSKSHIIMWRTVFGAT